MTDEEVSEFIKICSLGPKLSEEQKNAKWTDLKLPVKFEIKTASDNLYNK